MASSNPSFAAPSQSGPASANPNPPLPVSACASSFSQMDAPCVNPPLPFLLPDLDVPLDPQGSQEPQLQTDLESLAPAPAASQTDASSFFS